MIWLYLFFGPVLLLTAAYPVVIQYKRPGFEWLEIPAAIVGILDIILNYTTLALLTWDIPKYGEWTFSKRLARLRHDTGLRGKLVRPIVRYLDYFDPTGRHVA